MRPPQARRLAWWRLPSALALQRFRPRSSHHEQPFPDSHARSSFLLQYSNHGMTRSPLRLRLDIQRKGRRLYVTPWYPEVPAAGMAAWLTSGIFKAISLTSCGIASLAYTPFSEELLCFALFSPGRKFRMSSTDPNGPNHPQDEPLVQSPYWLPLANHMFRRCLLLSNCVLSRPFRVVPAQFSARCFFPYRYF